MEMISIKYMSLLVGLQISQIIVRFPFKEKIEHQLHTYYMCTGHFNVSFYFCCYTTY